MTSFVDKWLLKADNDFKAGTDEAVTAEPAADTVCFHMQQCIEKHLKAFLVQAGHEISRTHDIAGLIEMCRKVDDEFKQLYEMRIDALTKYAVDVRYPDDFYIPGKDEMEECCIIAKQGRVFIKAKIKSLGSS